MSYITITQNELSGITTDSASTVRSIDFSENAVLKVCSNILNVVLGSDTVEKTALVTFTDLESQLMSIDGFANHLQSANKELASTILVGEQDLRTLRLSQGYSQSELAHRIGSSQPHLNKIENGKSDPKLSTIFKMAKVLNVDEQTIINALKREAQWNQG